MREPGNTVVIDQNGGYAKLEHRLRYDLKNISAISGP
jgi:hypothetical protein